jgi:hypothetical protein
MPSPVPSILDIIKNPEQYLQGAPLRAVYRGLIEDVNDPDQLGRVRVRVKSIWSSQVPTDNLPWAEIANSGSMSQQGLFSIPPVGSTAFVIFQEGNSSFPIIIGGWYGKTNGQNEVPKAAIGQQDTGGSGKGNDQGTGAAGAQLQEPANPFAPTYPNNHVYKGTSGNLIEVDDTQGHERIDIVHKSGSWIEFHPDGSIVVGCQKKIYVFSTDVTQIHSHKDLDALADNQMTAKAGKDLQVQTGRDEAHVVGRDLTVQAARDILLNAARNFSEIAAQAGMIQTGTNLTMTAGQDITATAGGTLTFQAALATVINTAAALTLQAATALSLISGTTLNMTSGAAMSIESGAALSIVSSAITDILSSGILTMIAPVIDIESPLVTIGGITPGNVVTDVTHPIDFITGLPIVGTPVVRAG